MLTPPTPHHHSNSPFQTKVWWAKNEFENSCNQRLTLCSNKYQSQQFSFHTWNRAWFLNKYQSQQFSFYTWKRAWFLNKYQSQRFSFHTWNRAWFLLLTVLRILSSSLQLNQMVLYFGCLLLMNNGFFCHTSLKIFQLSKYREKCNKDILFQNLKHESMLDIYSQW